VIADAANRPQTNTVENEVVANAGAIMDFIGGLHLEIAGLMRSVVVWFPPVVRQALIGAQ
jgi:hypothetical protein